MFDLPANKYGSIAVDPPWTYTFDTRTIEVSGTGWRGSPQRHYPTMTHADLTALPVADLAAPNSVLWLWAVNSQMPKAFNLLDAWGFRYRTMLTWAKTTKDGRPFTGMGYWLRGATEHVLCATRGKPKPLARNIPSWFPARPTRHSEKPDEAYRFFEAHSSGPRVELFARARRPGWDGWGNEYPLDAPS